MAEPNINPQDAAHEMTDMASIVASSGVGTLLCATRMRMGKDLQRVAEVLHIRYNYLVAIEDGRYEDLPGQAYAIGFVRSFAEYLGLDGNEVVRRYKEESTGVKRRASFEFPIPTPDSGVPSGMLLLLAVVFGMSVYSIWYAVAGSDRSAVQLIQEVPSRMTALLGGDDAAPADVESESVALAGSNPAVVASVDAGQEAAGRTDAAVVMPAEDAAPAIDAPQVAVVANAPVEDTEELRPLPEESASIPENSSPEAAKPPAIPETAERSPAVEQESRVAAAPSPAHAPAPVSSSPAAAPESAEPTTSTEDERAPSSPNAETRAASNPNAAADEPAPEAPASTDSGPEADEQFSGEDESARADVVELRAKTDSWIQLRDGEELLLTRLLRKGETFRVPERGGLTLMTGNAGGLEVLVNGEVMPPLGNEGTVARGVQLDPKRLQGGG